jgi:hypothetical protein
MTGRSATSTPRNGRGLAILSLLRLTRPAYPAIRPPPTAASGGEPCFVQAPRDCTYTLYEHPWPVNHLLTIGYSAKTAGRLEDRSWESWVVRPPVPIANVQDGTVSRFVYLPKGTRLANVWLAWFDRPRSTLPGDAMGRATVPTWQPLHPMELAQPEQGSRARIPDGAKPEPGLARHAP